MDELLKGNFKVKNPVKVEDATEAKEESHVTISRELRKRALLCLGGSMVYIERERLTWDGDE